MNIVVCMKQVPDTTNVRIDPQTNTLIREGVESIINPFDMYAIEEALRMKERLGEGKVTVISMGPPQVEVALREAVSYGVDDIILISDRAFAGSDTWATSYVLASAIKKIGDVSIILCGKQAIDGDTAQVGPGIAAHLDIPQLTFVKKVEELTNDKIVIQRMLEEGYDVVESQLPCVVTVVKEINNPRVPSFKGKMRAKKAELIVFKRADLDVLDEYLGLDGSPTQVVKIFSPPQNENKGKIFTEDQVEQAIEEISQVLVAKVGKEQHEEVGV